ncbi:3-hydroxyacyl-[acyl-carrier-protein] dehydratase FabZ [Enterococcus florum]|uniref:3-hydroxyacyl-[acyl-carrier-protein] dehydratase n=1 Tax=Enterococcus florum TaxID=2480627 RepID=A0A4P5PJY0_9ENTE|nr:3-hydroxyacyl-ACP dehydratase FabZ [Enterococcus florum]GCF93643.1 3-hydroxyacyl-[acyl-carrier-protein] dehydratase FabZ [Enterococcus florum]
MEVIMNVEEIMAAIPNRFPIYYLDAVTEFEDEKHITAVKNLTMNEDFFQGYFPNDPMMPGTLIVEALAQAGSLLILKSEAFKGKTAYIGGINQAVFHQFVRPGDQLFLNFDIQKIKGSVGTAKAWATVEGQNVTECEFTFIVGDKTQQ